MVLLSVRDLESLEETLQLLGNRDAQERVITGDDEVARGKTVGEDEIGAQVARRAASG